MTILNERLYIESLPLPCIAVALLHTFVTNAFFPRLKALGEHYFYCLAVTPVRPLSFVPLRKQAGARFLAIHFEGMNGAFVFRVGGTIAVGLPKVQRIPAMLPNSDRDGQGSVFYQG